MGEEKYKVVKADEIDSYKRWVKQKVKEWHDFKPDYIGVTETAATPLGFLIKSAWKVAYPNEPVPKFLRVDHNEANRLFFNDDSLSEQEVERKYGWYGKSISRLPHNQKTRILFLDEVNSKCAQDAAHVVKKVWNLSEENIRAEEGKPEIYNVGGAAHFPESYNSKFQHVRPTVKRGPNSSSMRSDMGYNLRARVLHDSKYRGKARDYIHDVKLAGQEAGKELRAELEGKNLEGKVTSAIAIGSLVISILFMSSGITGNVIGNLNQTSSNWIGGVLFLIGLVGAFAYFKRK